MKTFSISRGRFSSGLFFLAALVWLVAHAFGQYSTTPPSAISLSGQGYVTNTPFTEAVTPDDLTAAFIKQAQLIRERDQRSVNGLVVRLKAANLLTNWVGFWPLVGSSETNQTPDLINPTNVIYWQGGATHSYAGATANGMNNPFPIADPFRDLGLSTNDFALYVYVAFTNNSKYLAGFVGTNAAFAIGSTTNFLVQTNSSGLTTNAAPLQSQGHFYIVRSGGSPVLTVYSGSTTGFITNRYNTPAFIDARLYICGLPGLINAGGSVSAAALGTPMTWPQMTNFFSIMHKFQAGEFRNVE